jgi:ATP-binding cassette subfamily F protein 3
LGSFLFRDDEVEKRISVLSGGERSRLLLCQILVQQPNLLLLDEPTNHLDIQGRRMLEQALEGYPGTICLISHDRHFINSIANKTMLIRNGQMEVFHGNYDDFQNIWKKRLQPERSGPEVESHQDESPAGARKSKEQKRLEAKRRNELFQQKGPLTERLHRLESAIDEITGRLEKLNALLADPTTYENGSDVSELTREHQQLQCSLEEHNRQWEETAIEIEQVEKSFWKESMGEHTSEGS